MSEIKPIQTRYKNYRFRSRLEARWGVFFDELGLDWEYENEGFDLGDGVWYLPDFCITSIDGSLFYYEVKPKHESGNGDKIKKLDGIFAEYYNGCDEKDTPVIRETALLCGDPYFFFIEVPGTMLKICPRCGFIHPENEYCFSCDMHTESGHNNPYYESPVFKGVKYTPDCGHIVVDDCKSKARYEQLILDAAISARSARFEHGQCG